MNRLNIITKCYAQLHDYPGVPNCVVTPLRKLIRGIAHRTLPAYLSKLSGYKGERIEGVIISFTSFPARILDVWQVVKCLKNQSVLPEKIILWLSKDQFPSKDSIPDSLWQEEDDLFEIRMVEGDIRSHKKFYYVMQEFPGKSFVTCDDDIYYHPDMLKHLIDTSKQYPGCVVANTARKITFAEDGSLMPYNKWKPEGKSFSSDDLIQIGVGGVLYPPHCLHELTLRKDLFWSLTPMADDIWLNCMARLNNAPVVKTDLRFIALTIDNDSPSLSSENKGQGKNDNQLVALREYLSINEIDVYANDCKISYISKA